MKRSYIPKLKEQDVVKGLIYTGNNQWQLDRWTGNTFKNESESYADWKNRYLNLWLRTCTAPVYYLKIQNKLEEVHIGDKIVKTGKDTFIIEHKQINN